MSGTIDKEFRPFVKQLKKVEGIELKPANGKNHVTITYNGKRVGCLPSSSSDRRKGLLALRTQLRRNGVPV